MVYGGFFAACLVIMGEQAMLNRSGLAFETYERRTMVLTPVYSVEEQKILIAEWGRVTSKADFEKIMSRMETLAKKYNVVLPSRSDE